MADLVEESERPRVITRPEDKGLAGAVSAAGAAPWSWRQRMQLGLWKLRCAGQHLIDRAGGRRWLLWQGVRWARRWREAGAVEPDWLRVWLDRPDGGRFWIPVSGASRWAAETCVAEDLEIAGATAAGIFDLIGSGPVQLGENPSWRRDLYSGIEWPLQDAQRLGIQRSDGSDIRTIWEMSRCYHFLPLARAYWRTGEVRFREAFVRHVESWIAANPLGFGPNWASPMDAAIRSANWTMAVLLFADAEGIALEFWERLLASLYATGLYLERHLEWHPVYRGNHYISNGVGLVYLGSLFRGTEAGDRWLAAGAHILRGELDYQVGVDGVSFEAALAYHRLVTEFFAYGGELIRLNSPEGWPAACEDRVRQMYGFIAAYLPESGEAPLMGDADDGRLHAASARGFLEPRRHMLGLPARYWPDVTPESGAFPQGGFYVLRSGRDHAIVRCGAVGLRGAGSHDHNDQLSFELVLGGRRVVADSGTYAYTRDLAARFAFRGTAAHSVIQLGGEEQNPIRVERPWRILRDRTRAECIQWEVTSDRIRFEGRHLGYVHRPTGAVCQRRITVRPPDGEWEVRDVVNGTGGEALVWRLHLEPGEVEHLVRGDQEHEFLLPGLPSIRIHLQLPEGLVVTVQNSEASDRYGVRYQRPCLVAAGEVILPVSFTTTFWVVE